MPEPGSPQWEANANAYVERVMDQIMEHGHIIQGVMANPLFAYTVGRVSKGKAEFYASGNMGPETMAHIINDICEAVDKGECDPAAELGEPVYGLIENLPVKFIRCDPEAAEMNLHIRIYDKYPDEAYQIVWPDEDGHFPGDEDYNEAFVQRMCPL